MKAIAVIAGLVLAVAAGEPAAGYTPVVTANGEVWGVQDGAPPRVDTGSIRETTSNALRGFGGIRVRVSGDPLRNGALLRGFALRHEPPDRFASTRSVRLGGVAVWRSLRFDRDGNWARWVDSFKNTSGARIRVAAVFGGQTGIGSATGATNARIVDTSSGDATLTPADSWALSRTGAAPAPAQQGPSAVVFGSLTRTANFLHDTFTEPPAPEGHEANFIGYQHGFTLRPGETRSLAHFVVIGTAESAAAPGAQVAAVRETAVELAAAPPLDDLIRAERCSLANWDVPHGSCPPPRMPRLARNTPTTTSARYDVVGKTIARLQADMEAGRTSSREITRGYLDRIAAYDRGPFGFNAYTYVARGALAQARAADRARARGAAGPLLGIPVTIKDLFDTKDMPTTNGSLVFEGFRPLTDATQVRRLREAGAVILGKASMEEYAQSGFYSDSAYGQVWNAFDPSKSSIASSGGTAVAIAASMAAAGLGSQTGDSLYGPAGAASLWTLRGTDGIASSYGVWPLTWLQDFPGSMARSAGDLADMLNATTGIDPLDPITVEAGDRRPADWRAALDRDALRGKRIGYYASAFVDPFRTTGTTAAQLAALRHFERAGATLVEIAGGPSLTSTNTGGDRNFTGWKLWIDAHPNSPYRDPREIIASPKRLPYRRIAEYTGPGMMTDAQIATYKAARARAKLDVAAWLDAPPAPVVPGTTKPSPGPLDAVVFPTLRSDISLNDGGSSSFGRGDPPTNSAGAPSVAFPAGRNDHREPLGLQLVGRAWDDPRLLAYAYAFDRVAHGHVEPDTAPPLRHRR